jgi:hypothetical protein
MTDGFVEVYAKSTGNKQWVPEHWLDHPVLGRDFEKTPSARAIEAQTPPPGEPSTDWSRKQLDQHAQTLGIDTSGLPNKGDAVTAIQDAVAGQRQTTADDQGDTTDSDGAPPADQTPAAGENQE